MSKAPEGAGSAAQGAEAARPMASKEYMDVFKQEVNKSIEEKKKKDDKLSGTVGDLKKAGTEVVEGLLQGQPAGQPLPAPEKFLQDFWKAFEARLKPMGDVRKQLKAKGIPDLRVTLGGIIHMTFYEHVVLPGLAKKDRPANDKFVATFGERFDEKFDTLLKKKEYKMYKDASAEVAGLAFQNIFEANNKAQEQELVLEQLKKQELELAQLKKQPRPNRNEKELRDENATLKEKNEQLQGENNNLKGRLMTKNESDADAAVWEHRYNDLQKRSNEEANLIAEMEQERDKLQADLGEARNTITELNRGRGSAQGQMKTFETKLQEQKDEIENGQIDLEKAKKQIEVLNEQLKESDTARTQNNADYERIAGEFEEFKEKVRASGSGSKDAEYQQTIKELREQAEKDKKEIQDLQKGQTAMLEKMEDDLLQADKKAEEKAKTKYKNIGQELEASRKAEEQTKVENARLREENKQLGTTHAEVEKRNASLTKQHAELTKKHEEVVKAQGAKAAKDGGTAAKKLADAEKERDQLRNTCRNLKESQKSLDMIVKTQKEKLEKSEADKAGAEVAGNELQGVRKERDDLRAANQKLDADLKEQQRLAAAKTAADEETLKANQELIKKLQDDNEKLNTTRTDMTDRVSKLQAEIDEFNAQNKDLKTRSDTTSEQNQVLQEQIKGLQNENKNLEDALNQVAGKGNGLETVVEVDEEGMVGLTSEQKAERFQKQWAAAVAKLNETNKDLGDLRRDYRTLHGAHERVEKDREDAKTKLAGLEAARDSMVAAEAEAKEARDAAETLRTELRAAVAAREAAEAAAAAAVAATGNATTGNEAAPTPGPTRTIGEVTLPQRVMDAVPGTVPARRFAGVANIFGWDAGRPIGGGGGGPDPGRRPSATLITGDWGEWSLVSAFIVATVMSILALLVIGAEGHKAQIWHAANHVTRAQYANDWYYFTVPVPQIEYIWYIFTRAAWAKM
ncbi:hypothetical protein PG996_012508 [Apiospora saccharicola]|uniref:Uncharacterized protein n=1 Tax=Apiospora saccharicola TaxID=335842 RepID=A0ABR1U2S1_9PEZI